MEQFDVVVVGGGPAGGHCARMLARQGHQVLLVERFRDFERNCFSSAVTPAATIARFDLPDTVVGSPWQRLVIVTSGAQGEWQAEQAQGHVLDFAKLRQFLADEVMASGGKVWMGCRYSQHQTLAEGVRVTLKHPAQQTIRTVFCRVLVDATGPARAILGQQHPPKGDMLTGSGVEYLIKVDPDTYQRQAGTLTFLLGHHWLPRGYSWVFPMEPNHLKIGACHLNRQHQVVPATRPLKASVDLLLKDYLKPQTCDILDVHGEMLRYSLGLRDCYAEGCIIAIGDAVSTVNFLGGEGIRHAMLGAEVAATYVDECLQGRRSHFDGYPEEMRRIFWPKWKISERLALKKYVEDRDALVDKVVAYLQPLSLEEVVDVLFYYRFEKAYRGLIPYILRRWRDRGQALWQRLRAGASGHQQN